MNKFIVLFLLCSLTLPISARARYMDRDELIRSSELICLIEVTGVEEVEKQGDHWKYRQKALVKRVQLLKGEVGDRFTIYAQKDFICGFASFKPGRYLVFLKREKRGFLSSTNHSLGALPVQNGKVLWYGKKRHSARKKQLLESVIGQILNS